MTTLSQRALRNLIPAGIVPRGSSFVSPAGTGMPVSFQQFARSGYAGNAIIYAGMNLIATSAAEPHIIGKRYRRNRRQTRAQAKMYQAMGISNRAGAKMVDALLVRNGFFEEVEDHPLITLLNNPNPFASRGQLWGMVTLDYHLAGNAYLLKARYTSGLLEGAVGELWRLRPDRVRVVPGPNFIEGYEYGTGSDKVFYPAADVMHFKTLNPLDAYYGMPPLMAVAGRIAIDNYMQGFLSDFFQKGGTGPGAIFSTKGRMTQADKDDARERFSRMFGPGNYTETLMLDNAEGFTYTPLSLNRGLRDALPKEIDAQTEARLSMVLNVPGAILGLLIGYETSSYANQRQAWQVLWDVKMTPMLSDFDDVLNLSLVPEFAGIDEVCFDLSDIRALQEDEDKMQDRHRKNFQVGALGLKEFRLRVGEDPELPADDFFFIPSSSVATPAGEVGQLPEPASEPAGLIQQAVALIGTRIEARVGRRRIEEDEEARGLFDEMKGLRAKGLTLAQIASRTTTSESTVKRYLRRFSESEDE